MHINGHIFIIEDAYNLAKLKAYLLTTPYAVTEAYNGKHALEILDTFLQIDVVILGQAESHIDGTTLLHTLQTRFCQKVAYGLCELMINAIEHGNLSISCMQKIQLLKTEQWHSEREKPLSLPHNQEKFGWIEFYADFYAIYFSIQDQGKGFEWESYLVSTKDRIYDPHGRGIMLARLQFSSIEYNACGNAVKCTLRRDTHHEHMPRYNTFP